ncbi:hypothetical protein C2E20_6326 [Micractinium conductrix]|uniref:DUF4460 domain-containing protein n=1 Tax=Micractinium conductrix TaxID=554055 RepID=A0A2P6V836_9CHLO|nr:hypothetical protein C2E20_6326 [Micractinium conductrix]|eukprot:PSC70243.1 hypothetical protein C2E20_6326 [Micractinium conductrix]
MDPQTERKFIRAIVRQVHPDLFGAFPYERTKNSDALKTLNVYADSLSQGLRPEAAQLTFFVRREGEEGLTEVSAELPSYGSLGPLFFSFGLITQEELRQGAGACGQGKDDRDLAAWLRETVYEAVRTADQHDSLKRVIREMRMGMEARFKLSGIQVGGEFSISTAEQRRQIDALKALEGCLAELPAEQAAALEGLSIRLYHPASRPLGTQGYVDTDGAFNLRTQPITSHVADNGVVHVVAGDPESLSETLPRLDLNRARLLAKLGSFWLTRSRDLSSVLQQLLGVEAVWCDTRTEDSSQQFVLWTGAVLDQRDAFESSLQGRRFAFSLLAHSDQNSPMLDFLASSSVLQVRCDCPPQHLLDFLCSSAGLSANEAAAQVAGSREEEEALLESVREALGAKHVIRVCSSYEQDKVLGAARRLLEAAPAIRAAGVDLSGASLAIDDCYELWDSGFISIPHDFNMSDLQPKLIALLGSGTGAGAGAEGGGASGPASGIANGSGANGGGANGANGSGANGANGRGANGQYAGFAAKGSGGSKGGTGAGRGFARNGRARAAGGSAGSAAAGAAVLHAASLRLGARPLLRQPRAVAPAARRLPAAGQRLAAAAPRML